MAVQYIAVAGDREPSVPLRRSSRRIQLLTTNAGPSILTSEREAPLVATRRNNNRPSNPSTSSPNPAAAPPTRKRSRPASDLQDEAGGSDGQQSSEPLPRLRPQRRRARARGPTIIIPATQKQPTPRAIRAQKRRKIADETRDKVTTTATSLSQTPSSTSASLSLSLPVSQPNPISPEPISPTNSGSTPAYVMKARPGKRKAGEFDKEGSSNSGLTGESTGDPLPRSLTKRRKIAPQRFPPTTTKDMSMVSTTKTDARTRQKLPQGINADRQVRRSARLQAASSSSQSADAPEEPPATESVVSEGPSGTGEPIVSAESVPVDLFSIPMSPLTPLPDDETPTPSPEPEPRPEQPPLPPPSEAAVPVEEPELGPEQPPLPPPPEAVDNPVEEPSEEEEASTSQEEGPAEPEPASNEPPPADPPTEFNGETQSEDQEDEDDMEMVASIDIFLAATEPPTPAAAAKFRTIIPGRRGPILKGRPPPNPLLYHQYQLAAYSRAKPNSPSPLSLYAYSGNTTPSSPALSATTTLDALDEIPALDPSAAAAFAEAEAAIFGMPIAEQYAQFDQQQFYEQQGQYASSSTSGYVQEGQPQVEQQSLVPQVYEQAAYQQQPQAVPNGSEPIFDMSFMMEFQWQLQLQQMQMAAAAGMAAGFGVGTEANQIPATVNMQDVHLRQQPHAGQPQYGHQQPGQDAQFGFTGFFGQPADQFGTYGQPQQHVVPEFGQQSETQYLGPVQEHVQFGQQGFQQFYPQFQHEYHPQEQQSAHLGYEVYVPGQHQIYDAPRVVQGYGQQQYFQPQQQVDVNAFASRSGYDGYTAQASLAGACPPSTSSVDTPVAPTTSHYTLGMHSALLYFQQTLARFHEQQLIAKQEAELAHVNQLFDFQREKEEKKKKLKRTKLITHLESHPMTHFTAHRSKTLWPLACKARMWEVARRYTSDLIREVTDLSARDYHRRMGLRYPYPQRKRRRRVARVHRVDPADDGKEDSLSPDFPIDQEGLEDEDEFRNEKIFDFELMDDDDEDMDIEEMKKLMEVEPDADHEEDDGDAEMDEEEEEEETSLDDEEDDDDDEDSEEESSPEADCDTEGTTITDPLFDPDLCMQVQPQGASSSSGVHESAFYVPPLDLLQVAVPQAPVNSQQDQQQEPTQDQDQTPVTSPSPLVNKLMVVQRPILSLPPPRLSTLRPQALKNHNMDPVLAGRGTPSIRVRRELWAGGPLPSFPVIQHRSSDVDQASANGISVDDANAATTSTEVANSDDDDETAVDGFAPGCVTTSFYDIAENASTPTTTTTEDTGSTPTLARPSAVCTHPVDESAVSVVARGEGEIGPEDAVSIPDSDTEFGDCIGSCCMSEKALGKRKAVDEDEDEAERGEGTGGGFEGCFDAGLTSTPPLPQTESLPAALPPSEHQTLHQTTMHQTVVLTPAIPDRVPLRRRAVPGRNDTVLKVQAPPTKPAPPMLPIARRPPRPFPQDDDPVMKSNGTYYHPIVPYSWELAAEALDLLTCHGIDARRWADRTGMGVGFLPTLTPTIILSGTEVQPTFYSSSSELSAALG